MRIGLMNKRVVIKLIDLTSDDGIGGTNSTEVMVDEIWAQLESLSSNERLIYGLEAGVRAFKMTTRFNIDLALSQRYVVYYTDRFNETRRFRITSVLQPDENARTFETIINERTD